MPSTPSRMVNEFPVVASGDPAHAYSVPVSINVGSGTGTTAATPYHYIATASANQDSQVVKASPGTLHGIAAFCNQAGICYAKLYDKATGPTSADTPIYTLLIPGDVNGGGSIDAIGLPGIAFINGLSFRLTNGALDGDATPVTAGGTILDLRFI